MRTVHFFLWSSLLIHFSYINICFCGLYIQSSLNSSAGLFSGIKLWSLLGGILPDCLFFLPDICVSGFSHTKVLQVFKIKTCHTYEIFLLDSMSKLEFQVTLVLIFCWCYRHPFIKLITNPYSNGLIHYAILLYYTVLFDQLYINEAYSCPTCFCMNAL